MSFWIAAISVRFQGKAKIDEGAINSFVSLLQRICTECDATLLVLWHPSQAGQDRGDASAGPSHGTMRPAPA